MNPPPDPQPNPNLPAPTASGVLPIQAESEIPNFDELIKAHRNLAGVLKTYLKPFYFQIVEASPNPNLKVAEARFERFFRPWPKWVFRLFAEVWHVQCPTIPKETFVQTLRVVNAMMFRCPTNPRAGENGLSRLSVLDQIDLRILPFVQTALIGHAMEHFKADKLEFDRLLAAGLISEKDYKARVSIISPEHLEEMLRQGFAEWSKSEGVNLSELFQVFEDARAKTFDKNGALKETPLTPIYRAMLYNWMTVERMCGPKELTNFLTPRLKGKSKSATGEQARIATLCSRIGVKFRGKSRVIELQ